MAKAGKKASKKRKAKKTRKALPARASKKAAAKKRAAKKDATKSKRVVKKAGKTAKKAAKKVARKSPKKAASKPATKSAKKPAKKSATKSANKATKARAVTPQDTNPAVQAAPVAKRAKPTTPRAKPASAAQPAMAAERNTYFITTAIAYPNGVPHIGHAYEAIATDALARFQRLERQGCVFPDRHRRARPEDGADRRERGHDAWPNSPRAMPRRFREMDERLNVSFDRFIRTTEPDHHRSVQVVWNRMQQNGDIYIDTYAGWYSVRDEAYYAEEETVLGEDQCAPRPAGLAGRMGRGEELFLQAVGLSGQFAGAIRESAGLHRTGFTPQRGHQFCERRPEGPLDLAHHVRLGRQGAERPRSCDVCLGRCADQLHHRRRLSRRERLRTGATGRRTCTSSARTSSASTRCTGRRS